MVTQTVKQFDGIQGMEGFSDTLIANHLKLYEGYVGNTNKLLEEFETLRRSHKARTPQIAELTRRFAWEFNGMRLHELYFENLAGGRSTSIGDRVAGSLTEDFDSLDSWTQDFMDIARMRGIGWVILYQDNLSSRLMNVWINEHDCGHLAGCTPLVVLDVFEHAYMTDYGLDRGAYISAFMDNLNWEVADSRLR